MCFLVHPVNHDIEALVIAFVPQARVMALRANLGVNVAAAMHGQWVVATPIAGFNGDDFARHWIISKRGR